MSRTSASSAARSPHLTRSHASWRAAWNSSSDLAHAAQSPAMVAALLPRCPPEESQNRPPPGPADRRQSPRPARPAACGAGTRIWRFESSTGTSGRFSGAAKSCLPPSRSAGPGLGRRPALWSPARGSTSGLTLAARRPRFSTFCQMAAAESHSGRSPLPSVHASDWLTGSAIRSPAPACAQASMMTGPGPGCRLHLRLRSVTVSPPGSAIPSRSASIPIRRAAAIGSDMFLPPVSRPPARGSFSLRTLSVALRANTPLTSG